jgi:hypothetical protein
VHEEILGTKDCEIEEIFRVEDYVYISRVTLRSSFREIVRALKKPECKVTFSEICRGKGRALRRKTLGKTTCY